MEIWKPIEGYEGLYEVSNLGRVKSFVRYPSGQVLKPRFKNGYPSVSLHHDNKCESAYVHRLVAKAFVPNLDDKPEVNHLNGVKSDNRAENLEWATHTENNRHAVTTGLHGSGANVYNAKLTNEQVIYIRNNPDNLTGRELAHMFGVGEMTISRIQLGKRYRSAGGRIREPNCEPANRIPDEIREQIRAEYKRGVRGHSMYALAKKFGIYWKTVYNIVHET